MIARKALVLITFGLSLGALFIFYESRAPIPALTVITATGTISTQLYNPKDILYIDMQSEGTVYLTQEEGLPTFMVEADLALMPFIEIELIDKTVKISRKRAENSFFEIPQPEFYIFAPDIASISIRGNATLITKNTLKIDSLDLNTRGSAVIHAWVDTKQLDVQSHGSSSITITGTAIEQHIQLHGSARYDALSLDSQECSIEASGTSIAQILVSELISGTISGSSMINFLGNPQIFVKEIAAAKITKYTPLIPPTQNTQY